MSKPINIGIIGDYDPDRFSHQATNDALSHAANHLSAQVCITWLPTESFLETEWQQRLGQFDGLWAAPGSPYLSLEGALKGIQFARQLDWPFIGT
ncbi:MAG: hypothetical protein JSV54_05715 [Chloroflexota bacterium]|nr:MAG: hypothetical protein JSV54_05715 [Chloroflexota bacterium]